MLDWKTLTECTISTFPHVEIICESLVFSNIFRIYMSLILYYDHPIIVFEIFKFSLALGTDSTKPPICLQPVLIKIYIFNLFA